MCGITWIFTCNKMCHFRKSIYYYIMESLPLLWAFDNPKTKSIHPPIVSLELVKIDIIWYFGSSLLHIDKFCSSTPCSSHSYPSWVNNNFHLVVPMYCPLQSVQLCLQCFFVIKFPSMDPWHIHKHFSMNNNPS